MGTDSLYYIMDYSGNYYRTNQADQLVSVVSQQDIWNAGVHGQRKSAIRIPESTESIIWMCVITQMH